MTDLTPSVPKKIKLEIAKFEILQVKLSMSFGYISNDHNSLKKDELGVIQDTIKTSFNYLFIFVKFANFRVRMSDI